ncbi:MAG TPA: glycosyltransferase family 2 protein [Flexilinea sp.]|nr:glycosyltransferase family 2 protein [Flexilinea sp.]HPG20849.1 glycosyltransferase family 2 protein [Flexilinea sp.]
MPTVSIIVPCLNEEKTITRLLDALYRQTYPISETEVIISDGNSQDRTLDKIREWHDAHPDLALQIVSNPKRIIPAALNSALEASSGIYIIRLDAHSIPAPDYVERCVRLLEEGKAENVGGRWEIQPGADTWVARSIANAASSPLGAGDAKYRFSETASFVDTVPYGAYKKETLTVLGGYDESLPINEDYDLNVRIRRNGGKIWFDPDIRCIYFSRTTFRGLAKQYWRYGYWKLRMLKKDPKSLRLRQLIPPLFVFSLLFFAIGSFFSHAFLNVLLLELIVYIAVLLFAGIRTAGKENDLIQLIGLPIALAIMHFSWGSGFIWSLIKLIFRSEQESETGSHE